MDPSVHPWAKLQFLVSHLDLYGDRMGDGVKSGIDISDLSRETLSAEGVDSEGYRHPLLQERIVLLRDADHRLDGRYLLDDDHGELG